MIEGDPMRHTNRETTTHTLTRLIKALDAKHPVTITYLKEEKDENGRKTGRLVETVRTVEIFNVIVTDAGHIVLRAMDRETGEMRSFRTDRIVAYSIHRTAYIVPRPVADEPKTRTVTGLATVTVAYPVDLPIATRVQLLADALAV
jgi:predicted DNA-binding transcriptional regulator YafY